MKTLKDRRKFAEKLQAGIDRRMTQELKFVDDGTMVVFEDSEEEKSKEAMNEGEER